MADPVEIIARATAARYFEDKGRTKESSLKSHGRIVAMRKARVAIKLLNEAGYAIVPIEPIRELEGDGDMTLHPQLNGPEKNDA